MKTQTYCLLLLMLLKFIVQYFMIHPDFELHRDEFLHLDLGNHLAWGYTSVPPLTGLNSALINLLGGSIFWVKFFPALFGALTLATVWKIIEELKGSLFAMILGAIAVTFSVIFRINTLYQPNSFDILCWTLLYYVLIKYINTHQTKWLYTLALVFALGFMNKYSITFLMLGLIPAILLSRHRIWFMQKPIYLTIGLALLLISPNLIWQYANDWPVFRHMRELAETQLVNVNRLDFLSEQLFFFFPALFVLLAAFISFFVYPAFKPYRFIVLSTLFTLLLFTGFRAKAYYAIGLYPVLMAFGAIYIDQYCRQGWKVYLKPVALLIPLLLFVRFLQIAFPIVSPATMVAKPELYKRFGMLRWEDGKEHLLPQDFADMQGWKELAEKVDQVYSEVKDKKHVLVYCDNYGEAGAINYYSRFPEMAAVSFNADYKYWFDLDTEVKTLISIKSITNDDMENKQEATLFSSIIPKGEVTNPYAREKGTKIFLMTGPNASINAVIKEELKQQ